MWLCFSNQISGCVACLRPRKDIAMAELGLCMERTGRSKGDETIEISMVPMKAVESPHMHAQV